MFQGWDTVGSWAKGDWSASNGCCTTSPTRAPFGYVVNFVIWRASVADEHCLSRCPSTILTMPGRYRWTSSSLPRTRPDSRRLGRDDDRPRHAGPRPRPRSHRPTSCQSSTTRRSARPRWPGASPRRQQARPTQTGARVKSALAWDTKASFESKATTLSMALPVASLVIRPTCGRRASATPHSRRNAWLGQPWPPRYVSPAARRNIGPLMMHRLLAQPDKLHHMGLAPADRAGKYDFTRRR